MRLLLILSFFLLPLGACRTELREGASDLGVAHGPGSDLAVAHDLAKGSPCHGLDETSCKHTTGCVADFCEECSCTPTYVGCRPDGDMPTQCPGLGCEQAFCCRAQAQCSSSGLFCTRPDDPRSGIPVDPPSRCPDRAYCTVGQDCIDGHCATDTACPKLGCASGLVCDLDDKGIAACVHLSCTDDSDCERGFCVLGACYRTLGTCEGPPPP